MLFHSSWINLIQNHLYNIQNTRYIHFSWYTNKIIANKKKCAVSRRVCVFVSVCNVQCVHMIRVPTIYSYVTCVCFCTFSTSKTLKMSNTFIQYSAATSSAESVFFFLFFFFFWIFCSFVFVLVCKRLLFVQNKCISSLDKLNFWPKREKKVSFFMCHVIKGFYDLTHCRHEPENM